MNRQRNATAAGEEGISGDRLRSTPTRFQNPTTTKSSPQANRQEVSRESKHSRWICPPSPAGRPPCVFTFFFCFSRTASKLNLGARQSTNAMLPPHATQHKLYLFLLVE